MTDTYGRNYAYRLKGTGRPVKWTEEVASLIEAIRLCRLLGRDEREIELSRLAIRLFSGKNAWKYAGLGPEGSMLFDTPAGPALVAHSSQPIDLNEYSGATVDLLPDSFLVPGIYAYVVRLLDPKVTP